MTHRPFIDASSQAIADITQDLDLASLLGHQGRSDDVFDIGQVFIPSKALFSFIAGMVGFFTTYLQKTPTSLLWSMVSLFVVGYAVHRMMVGARLTQIAVHRRDLSQRDVVSTTQEKS